MDAPPVQYVTTSDGYSIAYATSGSGVPLVQVAGPFSHVQLSWEYVAHKTILEGLASRFRLVQYDSRGQGMSTRGLTPDTMTIEHLCQDLETVVDTLGLDHFVLLSAGHIGTVAILYACRHPERVEALALLHCGLNAPFSPAALFKEVPSQSWDVLLHNLLPRGLPTEEREASLRILRASMTAADYATHLSAVISYDRLRQLELLTTPALVMHVRDFPHLPVEESMSLASQIQDARFMLIPGETMYGDGTTVVDAIEGFLATLPINGQAATKSPPSSPSDLSERELSVLRLIATGRSNQQIADELVISVNTVIRHVSNIFAKTGAANRAQATAYAKDHGIA